MKTTKRGPGAVCTAYQQQLVQLNEEDTPLHTSPDLNAHIQNCPECSAFLQILMHLRERFAKEIGNQTPAHRSVLKNTLAYMEIRKRGIEKKENLWDYISALLRYRIPVYQAVGGFIVLLFISAFLWNSKSLTGNSGMSVISGESADQQVYVSDTLLTERSKRGQNAREDSILVSFLQYSL